MLGVQELFKKHGVRGDLLRELARDHGEKFVLERVQAGRLESEHRQAARHVGFEHVKHPLGFLARLLDEPGGQEGTATAQRPFTLGRAGKHDTVSGGFQNPHRSAGVLGLEPAIEGVHQQHNFAIPVFVWMIRRPAAEIVPAPGREAALCAQAQ